MPHSVCLTRGCSIDTSFPTSCGAAQLRTHQRREANASFHPPDHCVGDASRHSDPQSLPPLEYGDSPQPCLVADAAHPQSATLRTAHAMRNELHIWLKRLHRLTQFSRFLRARDQKYLCPLETGGSESMLSSQFTAELNLVVYPVGWPYGMRNERAQARSPCPA